MHQFVSSNISNELIRCVLHNYSLKPVDNCVDVPKEVCVRMRTNPRKVKKPVIKKWCYVPTEESGLVLDFRSKHIKDNRWH